MQLDGQSIDLRLAEVVANSESRLKAILDRRVEGPVTPNEVIFLNVRRFRKLKEKRALAIASWWLGDLGCLIRIDLLEESDLATKVACTAKAGAIEILQSNFSERDFFGNFLPLVARLMSQLKFIFLKQRRNKRILRRRGYRDHGTLRPTSSRTPTQDWSLTEAQNQIEEARQTHEDTYQFLLGLAGLV